MDHEIITIDLEIENTQTVSPHNGAASVFLAKTQRRLNAHEQCRSSVAAKYFPLIVQHLQRSHSS